MPKILILRFSSIGDIVLTTPVIRCIKKQVPDAEVHFVSKETFKPVLGANPYIDKLISFRDDLPALIKELKKERYDLLIDLHKNLRTMLIKMALGIKSESFNKLNLKKWWLVHTHINRMPDLHIVDRYMEPASKLLKIHNDGAGLDYYIPQQDQISPTNVNKQLHEPYIAFVIGAQHATKRLTKEKAAALCRHLNYPVVLLGGPDDTVTAEAIATQSQHPNLVNTCGKLSLNQSASLIQQAEVVLTHDTGLMHIAAAFGKKIISIWGNTVPELGMYPYQAHSACRLFEIKNLACRPCSKIGYTQCPKKHFRCINQLDEKEIAQAADQLFSVPNTKIPTP